LTTAERLYAWTCKNLQAGDGLFYDNIRPNGSIDRRKFSYNSALMIQANCLFFEILKDGKYLAEAQRIAERAESQWIVADNEGVKDSARFAHLLLESFLALHDLDDNTRWLDLASANLVFVHDRLPDAAGRYPGRWDRVESEPLRDIELIDQASVARAYLALAHVLKSTAAHP
jgi:uncharacterized protein YyaL (SSP411 family)